MSIVFFIDVKIDRQVYCGWSVFYKKKSNLKKFGVTISNQVFLVWLITVYIFVYQSAIPTGRNTESALRAELAA